MRQVCNEKLFLLLFLSLLASITSTRGAVSLGCEDRSIDLRCPANNILQIVSSFYGRSESIPCHTDDKERMMNTKCSLASALEVTSNKCNNQSTCNIDIKSFPDPCPDTYKYLKIEFLCVVYVFTCPGSLVGLRSRHVLETAFRYNRAASWSKDPLFKPKRIYYHVEGDPTIKEYEDESIFRQGGDFISHDLKTSLKSSHFAIFSGYIYYYKTQTNTIAKYSTKMKSRRSESNLPQTGDSSKVNEVRLAVDEQGIWMSYYQGESGLTILKLDPDFKFKKQWKTDITRRHKHVVFVCGVMYAFDDGSSAAATTFNTNNGVTSRNSMFNDRDHLQGPNISSIHYNPRDRILMAWQDASAVYYRLDFSPDDPTRKEDLSTKNGGTMSSTLTTTTVVPGQIRPVHGKCPAEKINDLQWPQTVGGKTSKVECYDKIGEFASWRCVLDGASGEASWEPNGPDRADCLTSFKYIRHRIARGDKDVAEKLPALLEEKAHSISGIDITSVATATKLFVNDWMMYSDEDRTELAKVVIAAVNALTSPACVRKVRQMSKTQRYLFISDIITAVENALLNIPKKSLGKGGFVMRMSNVATLGYSYDRLQTYDADFKGTSNETITGTFNEQKDNWASLPFQHGDSFEDVPVVGFALFRRLDQCLSAADVANWRLDSDMVSISIDGGHGGEDEIDLDNEARVTLRHQSVDKPRKHKCVYWRPSNSNPLSPWSDTGCREITSNSTHTTCGLRHLTTFALLAEVDADHDPDGHGFGADSRDSWFDNPTLSISMSVGISVSALCLFFCFTTFIVFKKLQNDLNCIVKHFSMTLFVAEVSYMVAMHRPSNEIACYVVAFLLHLSLLATFVWLALETFQIYVLLGDYVEPSSYRWKWYYLIGYGGPTVIVMVSAFVNIRGYQGDTWCWLDVQSSSMLAFILPLVVAVITSVTFLIITMVKLHRQSTVLTDSSRLRMVKNGVRSAGSLLFLLGLTWMFGLVWMWERSLIIAYLFLFFNVFQGFFVFFVHCVLQRKVRREYSDRLNGWRCCLGKSRMGDMTYVSSSMSFSKHYTSPGSARYNTAVPCASNLANPNNQSQLRRLWSETIVNGGSGGGNQHPSESAAILYNSESVPTRDHSVSNYGPGCPGSNGGNGGYLEPQMMTNQQQQQQHQEQHERRHNNMADMNYCHNKSCRADEQHLARENTYKYDRLDRHGLPNNTPDDMTSRNDDLHPNNRVYTDITVDQDQECTCARRHHQSRPQQRSYTMNPHSTTVASTQSNSMPDTAVHCNNGVTRASTISKAVQQQHHHWPEEYATPVNQEDASSMCIRPYQITPLAPISANRRRTSMNSTEESDITNDMSTSSFENRASIGRATNVVPQHQNPQHPKEHLRHPRPERWTPVTTSRPGYDENDLEVERCLFSRDNNSNNAYPATERDSAFYQSMPDLNHQQDATPSSNLCYGSSPSSGCSPEMASADDDLHHHHHASSFQTRRTSEQSSLISAPQNNAPANAKSFASTGATANTGAGGGSESDTRQPSSRSKRVYEDVSLLVGDADHLDSGNGPRPTYVLTASRLNRDDDFARGESPVRLSGSHLQTCL